MSRLVAPCFLALATLLSACSSASAPIEGAPLPATSAKPGKDAGATAPTPPPANAPPPGPGQTTPEELKGLFPEQIFSGFTPGSEYKVPVFVELEGADVKWETADPAVATVIGIPTPKEGVDAGFKGSIAMITMKQAGATKVLVSKGATKYESPVTVTAYTAEALAAGSTRYKTEGAAKRQACATCHEGEKGVDHSPGWLAAYDDANILKAIETGVYGDGYKLNLPTHQWELAEPEKIGIMAYLRALPPRGF